ncbi:hypothetical protein GCM10027299_21410 [Larkinella ripae]
MPTGEVKFSKELLSIYQIEWFADFGFTNPQDVTRPGDHDWIRRYQFESKHFDKGYGTYELVFTRTNEGSIALLSVTKTDN